MLNPLSGNDGSISRFGKRDPTTLRIPDGSGIGVKYELNKRIDFSVGYLANGDDAANPKYGLFSSSYSIIAQLVVNPNDNLALALTYTHVYETENDVNLVGSTGSEIANQPFEEEATSSDRVGLQVNWLVTDNLELGGWVGLVQANQQSNGNDQGTIINGAFTLAFNDLGAENNLGGIIIGVPPIVINHTDSELIPGETTLHLEIFYRLQIQEHLEITPGLFMLINPDTVNGNPIWIGTIRTRLNF